MEAKDLRIGNYVEWFGAPGSVHIVSEIFRNGNVNCVELKDPCHINQLKPILLTEAWLVKFGVNSTKTQDVTRVNYVNYHQGTDTYEYCMGFYWDTDGYIEGLFKEIKYVHQLQNLFHALTGEELNAN